MKFIAAIFDALAPNRNKNIPNLIYIVVVLALIVLEIIRWKIRT